MSDFFKRSPMQELSAHTGHLNKNLFRAVRITFINIFDLKKTILWATRTFKRILSIRNGVSWITKKADHSIQINICKTRDSHQTHFLYCQGFFLFFNRYKKKRPKVDASNFETALSHTCRSVASEKKEKKIACPLLDVFAFAQVSSPRLYRLRNWDS